MSFEMRDCTSPVRVRVKNASDSRCRCRNTAARRSCMTRWPTWFEKSVCTTPRAPVTIAMAIIPPAANESSLVSLLPIASNTRLSRNAGTTPRPAERTIRARTPPSLSRYGVNRPPIRRRLARRTAGSAGRSGGASAEWKNMPIRVRVRRGRGEAPEPATVHRGVSPPARQLALERRSGAVLLVRHVLAPIRRLALVVDLDDRDVGHEPRRRRAVPVLLARLEEDAVTWTDHLDGAAAPLRQPDPFSHPDGLPVRVRVPGRAGSRREVDAAGLRARSCRGRCYRVDVDVSREPLAWAGDGLDGVPRDFHE